jgi:hypothetical protein
MSFTKLAMLALHQKTTIKIVYIYKDQVAPATTNFAKSCPVQRLGDFTLGRIFVFVIINIQLMG